MNPRLGSSDPTTWIEGSLRSLGSPGMNPRLGSKRMNPRRESGMETATKTGIEKVEDLLLKKFGIKKTEGSDRQTDRLVTAVESYIGSD